MQIEKDKSTGKCILFLAVLTVILMIPMLMIKNDGDTYHLLTSGRDIWETRSVPVLNTHFAYEGLGIVLQQWLYALILYVFYRAAGVFGMQVLLLIEVFLFGLAAVKIGRLRKAGPVQMMAAGIITALCCIPFMTPRPYMITAVMLMWQYYIQEKAFVHGDRKALLFLPVLFITAVNMHGALWPYHAGMFLLFMIPDIPPLRKAGMFEIPERTVRAGDIGIFVISLGAMLVNPYGIDMVLYVFRAMAGGVGNISKLGISELYPARFMDLNILFPLAVLMMLLFSAFTGKRDKPGIRLTDVLFLTAGIILSGFSQRHCILSVCALPIAVCSPVFRDIVPAEKKTSFMPELYREVVSKPAVVALCVMIASAASSAVAYCRYEEMSNRVKPGMVIGEYLKKTGYEGNVYTMFEMGTCLEFLGYRVTSDSRPELLFETVNGVEDKSYALSVKEENISRVLTECGCGYAVTGATVLENYFIMNDDWEKADVPGLEEPYGLYRRKNTEEGTGNG